MSKKPPEDKRIARRQLLAGGVALAGSAASAGIAARSARAAGDNLPPNVPAWMKEQGAPYLSPPYGRPSPFEKNVIRRERAPTPTQTAASSMTPLQDLHGIITPNGLHFERHHAGVPAIDPDQHRLIIHGLVERPLIFTMDDIVRFPVRVAHLFPRMLRQHLLDRNDAAIDGPAYAWRDELLRMDGRALVDGAGRDRR